MREATVLPLCCKCFANGCQAGVAANTPKSAGCLVLWHDSRFGCERSRAQFPEQPMTTPTLLTLSAAYATFVNT